MSTFRRQRERGTDLVLVYRKRLFLQNEILGPPQPADQAVLLDVDDPIADDVGIHERVRCPIWGTAYARVC